MQIHRFSRHTLSGLSVFYEFDIDTLINVAIFHLCKNRILLYVYLKIILSDKKHCVNINYDRSAIKEFYYWVIKYLIGYRQDLKKRK